MMPLRFVPEARMRQCFGQQQRVAKLVTDALLEWIHNEGLILANCGAFSRTSSVRISRAENSLVLFVNGQRRYEIDRALRDQIAQSRFFRAATVLGHFDCFEFWIRAGKQGGFIEVRALILENKPAHSFG